MVNVEHLAITAIFGFGLLAGYKIKGAILDLREYFVKNKRN